MLVKLNTLCLAFLAMLIVTGVYADESKKPDVDTGTTIYELMTKQDSVLSIINSQYQSIKPILQHSCFDCHSENTSYPWYHKLPIVKGILDGHIAEGREHLDLTNDFPFGGKGSTLELLGEIKKEIEEDEMPLVSYRMLHWGRLIEGERRDSVFQWIDNATVMLNDFYDQHGGR